MTPLEEVQQPSLQSTIRACVSRIVTLQCADSGSRWFGCVDREFWAYRTTRGFASSPFQHVMSGLAYVSTLESEPLQQQVRDMSLSALDFWLSSRNKNGSANEWYRNEQSYCATAMGLHALCETLHLLKGKMSSSDLRERLYSAVASEKWLHHRKNPLAINQDIASSAGRYVLGSLLDDKKMCEAARDTLAGVKSTFDEIGYLPEYGGMDIGYNLLSVDLLVTAHQAGLEACETVVSGVCAQMHDLVRTSRWLPYELGSRGTRHKFFGGVSYFSKYVVEARQLLDRCEDSRPHYQMDRTGDYDDRFFATFSFSALARRVSFMGSYESKPDEAALTAASQTSAPIEHQVVANGTLFSNKRLGYGLVWHGNSGEKFDHLGYVLSDRRGRKWTSLTEPNPYDHEYSFKPVSDFMPLIRYELLTTLVFTACRVSFVSRMFSYLARTRVGRPRRSSKFSLRRVVKASEQAIVVEDRIRMHGPQAVSVFRLKQFPYHSPSLMTEYMPSVSSGTSLDEFTWGRGVSEVVIRWSIESDMVTVLEVVSR